MRTARHILKQFPAIALLLLFVSGWLAAPLSLALPEPITCGMVCCEESGECCCFLSRQAHQHSESDDEAQFIAFRKSCPANWATPPSFSNHTFPQKLLPSLLRLELGAQAELPTRQTLHPIRLELCRKSAPRGPPIFS